ncbi:hypothetical protein KC19_11G155400 [Ceratodon purpureus]|uniref:Uncharacterized protein n=1 Tax=Ceratodon purpureus TaxID=3225 RepID=A0A8T0GL25_CERPU|nr:hypothetical protein KC19_11G155400 [Ceratodon purpureus]
MTVPSPSTTSDRISRSVVVAATVVIQGDTFEMEPTSGPWFPPATETNTPRLAALKAAMAMLFSKRSSMPVSVTVGAMETDRISTPSCTAWSKAWMMSESEPWVPGTEGFFHRTLYTAIRARGAMPLAVPLACRKPLAR